MWAVVMEETWFTFLRKGYEVFGVDPNVHAVETVRELSAALAPDNPWKISMVYAAENLFYGDAAFDLIIK